MNITVDNLYFSYNKKDNILCNLSHRFESGKCYLLKGANGSGKTTLSKLLCGLLKSKEGVITIDGKDINQENLGSIAQKIGYLFQNCDMHFFCHTVYEELTFPFIINSCFNQGVEKRINEILDKFKLTHLKEKFPLLLSGGEKQRLALATIFIRDIDFIILDEPTSAIDYEGKRFLACCIDLFVKNGGGALVISHDEEFRKMLNVSQLLKLSGGKLYED